MRDVERGSTAPIVKAHHGEVDLPPVAASSEVIFEEHQLTRAEAAELTARIGQGLDHVEDLIKRAYLGRAWLVLGFGSWNAWVQHHFGDRRLIEVSREGRRETVGELNGAGMSTRQIGSVLGVSDFTVRGDLKALDAAGARNHAPDKVMGPDGKWYPARQPDSTAHRHECEVCGGTHPEADEDCPVIAGAFDAITVGPTSTTDIPPRLRDSSFGRGTTRSPEPSDDGDLDDVDSEAEPFSDQEDGPAATARAVTRQADTIVSQWVKIRDDLEELPGLLDDADVLLNAWPADAPVKMPAEVAGDGLAALEAVQQWEASLPELLHKWKRIVNRLDRMTR